MTIARWQFHDPVTLESYTVPINPNKMGSLFPTRAITIKMTTAVDGQTIYFEGNKKPADWSFQGSILDSAHHEALKGWVYNHGRIEITDHFGRVIKCVLIAFQPVPPDKQKVNRYWRHDYTITASVYYVGDPAIT